MVPEAPKNELLDSFVAPVGPPWGVFGPTLGAKCLHRGCTATVQAHREALWPKKVPTGLPKWASAAQAQTLWRLGKTAM